MEYDHTLIGFYQVFEALGILRDPVMWVKDGDTITLVFKDDAGRYIVYDCVTARKDVIWN